MIIKVFFFCLDANLTYYLMETIWWISNWFKSGESCFESRIKRLPLIPSGEHNKAVINSIRQFHEYSTMPPIFRLTIDCFDEIFEYLPLNDLYSFGQTCRTMQKVAGEYFQRNFSTFDTICCDDGIYTKSNREGQRINISKFSRYITHISHYNNIFGPDYYVYNHIDEFKSINRINFDGVAFNSDRVKYIQAILEKAEVLQVSKCSFEDDFHENLLKFCGNLKRLNIKDDLGYIIRTENWLLGRYPMLEYLEFKPRWPCKIEHLYTFFEQNRNLRGFSTCSHFIWFNRYQLLQTNAKLDILHIKCIVNGIDMKSLCNILNRFYERGFYRRLHLDITELDEKYCGLLLHGIEKLHIKHFSKHFRLASLINIKELKIFNGVNLTDMEILAKFLINLSRVRIENVNYDEFLPFIYYSAKLNVLELLPKHGEHFNGGILNLSNLNDKRSQLDQARKVLIYVPDNIFLATKWTTKHGDINLNLIEMKRNISYNYEEEF